MSTAPISEDRLAERHRLGHDRFDEMWEGVLHMVPPPSESHQALGIDLASLWHPLAKAAGLHLRYEIGLFDPAVPDYSSYRQPDLAVFGESVRSARGIEGAADLVVELRSPGDESLDKIPFYSRVGVQEMLVIDRDTKEVRRWVAVAGRLVEQAPGDGGWHDLSALPVRLAGAGGVLTIETPTGTTEV